MSFMYLIAYLFACMFMQAFAAAGISLSWEVVLLMAESMLGLAWLL